MKSFVFLAFVGLFTSPLQAQIYKGFVLSHSTQDLGSLQLDVNYKYKTYVFQYLYSSPIVNTKRFSANWELNPQLSLTQTKEVIPDRNENGWELGIILGATAGVKFLTRWYSYLGIGIGPQYISSPPQRQKKGFIFSDNLFWGNRIGLTPITAIDLRLGLRHQSNASIGQPNGGINSVFVSLSFLRSFLE